MQNLVVSNLQPSLFAHTTLPTNNLSQRLHLFGHFDKFFNPRIYPTCRKCSFSCISAKLSSGVARFSSSTVESTQENVESKIEDTVFVAGATGKVGSRTVRELLKIGFQVKAGVRSAQRAESLIQSVKEMKLDNVDTSGVKPIEKLEIVECDLEKRDQIVPALGGASIVICCIGASEKEIFDVTGPYRIDYLAAKNLINAARVAKVKHFILLTSLGTNKIGFPAAILNLFWGVLVWKRKAEEELIASGLPYTIVRPGGMERPTDSYKETHNITLSLEDTLFGGQVSNLQVAELLSVMAQNRDLSYCKIVEVVAETTAPLFPMEDLLAKIPSKRKDIPKAKRLEVVAQPLIKQEPAKSSTDEAKADVAVEQTVQVENVVAKPSPQSPFTAYEDLKPPSSPTPSAPVVQRKEVATPDRKSETPDAAPKVVDGVTQVIDGNSSVNDPREFTFYHSPFPAYDDLKPPTSPTPTAPNSTAKTVTTADTKVETTSISTDNGVEPSNVSSVNEIEPSTNQTPSEPKPRPLSPYTMYDDMKPPCSPTPSLKNH